MRRGLRAWYLPSWNGDLRLEPAEDPSKTTLTIEDPTEAERNAVSALRGVFAERGWLDVPITDLPAMTAYREGSHTLVLSAPLEKVGPVVMALLKPGPAVLSAVKFKDGQLEVVEHRPVGSKTETAQSKTETALAKVAKKDDAEAAVTVKRATPCCPDCYVDAIKPASEVLLAFLTPEQHETWRRERFIVCRGGLSGHRYVLAHRNSPIAARNKRICFDADDRRILHFHDQSVPPEEEVLGAMLVLQHREDWLRNEATCLLGPFERVFKNPFGSYMDGVADSAMTTTVGLFSKALVES